MKYFYYVIIFLFFSKIADSKFIKTVVVNDQFFQVTPTSNCFKLKNSNESLNPNEMYSLIKIQGNRISDSSYKFSYQEFGTPMYRVYKPFIPESELSLLNPYQIFRFLQQTLKSDQGEEVKHLLPKIINCKKLEIDSPKNIIIKGNFLVSKNGVILSGANITLKDNFIFGVNENKLLPHDSVKGNTSISQVSWTNDIIKFNENDEKLRINVSVVSPSIIDFIKDTIDLEIWNPSEIKICFKVEG